MRPSIEWTERNLLAAASVAAIALAVLVALAVGPRQHRAWLTISGLVGVAMAFPSLFTDPRDLLPSLVFSLPPVMALVADPGTGWLVGPLGVLVLVGAELNAACWAAEGSSVLHGAVRGRLLRIGQLALWGLGASVAATLAARLTWLDSTLAVVVAAGALAGLATVVFSTRRVHGTQRSGPGEPEMPTRAAPPRRASPARFSGPGS